MKRAVVIVPTYNERENVTKLIPWLTKVFSEIKHWEMEILIVDDTSPDKTYEVVEQLQKEYRHLHLLLNKNKAGLGGAYLRGMEHAFTALKADVAFQFDADLSHDATKIPLFLAKIDEGYDFVLGSRYIKGGSIPNNWGLDRKFFSVVGNLIIMFVFTHFAIRDWTTGFRALKREVYEAVGKELTGERFSGYTFQIGFLHKALRKGFKITEVPFHFVDRTIGESKLGAEYIKNNLMYIFKVRFQEIKEHRIFKFVVVGGTGALIQLLALSLYRQFLNYEVASFFAIESAVVSNFILNNVWTFADRKVEVSQLPASFVTFNLASAGSIVIQYAVALGGKLLFGLPTLFMIPFLGKAFDAGQLYAILGILIGMFWNFFAYNKFVWTKK